MAVDTPVLERNANERTSDACGVRSRIDALAEEVHNARIRDTYARLINPENKIEDVLHSRREETAAVEEQPVMYSAPVSDRPYRVENARADSLIFRADSAVNMRREEVAATEATMVDSVAPAEEESEDLRPTPTTIQYQTLGSADAQKKATASVNKKAHVFGKREKIIVAVFVAVVVVLLALVIVNSAIIANLNTDIANVQESITTVRGALAGVNGEIESIIKGALGQ